MALNVYAGVQQRVEQYRESFGKGLHRGEYHGRASALHLLDGYGAGCDAYGESSRTVAGLDAERRVLDDD